MKNPNLHPLPHPKTRDGALRLVGVEIELGGLDEDHVADITARQFKSKVTAAKDRLIVDAPDIGPIEIYLDTRYRAQIENLGPTAKRLSANVVPVEIVTPPLDPASIPQFDQLVGDLRRGGAQGTKDGVLLGFGVHFNPEIRSLTAPDIVPVVTAFALLEDYIRLTHPIDLSRTLLPFVDRYPVGLIDALATDPPDDMRQLAATYLDHVTSRYHALDMTCILAEFDNDLVASRMDMAGISARPTFHYRLPDFRPSDPEWSLCAEWNRWVWLEEISSQTALLNDLRAQWTTHRDRWFDTRNQWAKRAGEILADHNAEETV